MPEPSRGEPAGESGAVGSRTDPDHARRPDPDRPGGFAATPPGDAAAHSTLLSLAPAATDLPHLLRIAIDAEQVGAARIHLPVDQPDAEDAVAAIRAHTGLVVTAEPGSVAAPLADRPGPAFAELVLPESLDGPGLLTEIARIVAEHPHRASVGGAGDAALPVLLAALAVGLHLRVGTADRVASGAPTGPREDVALIGRAAGLARIAGRPAMPLAQARVVLGLP